MKPSIHTAIDVAIQALYRPDEPMRRRYDVVICHASELEGAGLPLGVGSRTIFALRTGVGPVNAAYTLTRFLSEHSANAVIVCGVGGAYPSAGLEPGDVVSATSETYGDLGAESPQGFLDMEALGFPVIDGAQRLFNRLPLDIFPTERRAPFVTCATCTGSDATAELLSQRTGGAVESMEGAALVHVARLMGVRVGEVRGISNAAGKRDRASWKLHEAAGAARAAVVQWIEDGGC
jgi:futalosine hydrolase